MGKRSSFERIPKDLYRTIDARALPPLLPHLREGATFYEPCAGYGDLLDQLVVSGYCCAGASDIEPMRADMGRACALNLTSEQVGAADYIITNPPWTRSLLHPMIEHFRQLRETWLLFDAGWAHTQMAAPFLPYCHSIVVVPRLKWIPGTKQTAKDDVAWYGFSRDELPTEFFGSMAA